MSVIIILIIFSVLVASGFLAAFIWAVKTGQYDDTTSPAVRILNDDKKKEETSGNSSTPENPGDIKNNQETSNSPGTNPKS